jgi:hypothetical protein
MKLDRFSMGIGDRFGHQGKAQLQSLINAADDGVTIAPVWNKSHREHTTIHSTPADVRIEADAAVSALDWNANYYVDADHIGMKNVDLFIDSSDFFTLDVADFTGESAGDDDITTFVNRCEKYTGSLSIPGIDHPFDITREDIELAARKYLLAVKEAGALYRHIESTKGSDNFVTEVSMDETDKPQTPLEMLFILAAIAGERIPAQTIAPKFTGRFNKGVDYVGNVDQFTKEFDEDLSVISFAIKEFGLPDNLKLSVHSGSDKFAIYRPIHAALKHHDAGLHLKTAGTTWLEELIGLASAGGEGLVIACEVYRDALGRFDELATPYATVIDIDKDKLPAPEVVEDWAGKEFASALRHDQSCPEFNIHFRQLLHVAYKVAAEMGDRYTGALKDCEETIAANVTENLYERHIKPLFILE